MQLLDRDVDVDDLVGAIEERVGHGFTHADAGHAADGVVERLEVLDVDRGEHADAGIEKLEDVLIALFVRAARDVGVGELVDDAELRPPRAGWHRHPFPRARRRGIRSSRRGTTSRSPNLRLGVGSPVRLDEADDDVHALASKCVRVLEHRVGLADARRGADVDPQSRALLGVDLREHLFGRSGDSFGHRLMLARDRRPADVLYGLFMTFVARYELFMDS